MRDFANLQGGAWTIGIVVRSGLALLFAAVLAFLAPLGTYRFDPVDRVGYWTVQMAAWLLLSTAGVVIVARLSKALSWSLLTSRLVPVLVATIPMMGITGVANNMMTGWLPDPAELLELFLSILLIGGGHMLASDWLTMRLIGDQTIPTEVLAATQPEFHASSSAERTEGSLMARLPAHLRNGILCLQVEDHYVRAYAPHGSAMVLMRFSDALQSVAHLAGSQVHRSWWVADDAVTGLTRTGRTARLTLSNGVSVPVSQPYLAEAIRAWGMLKADAR